MNIIGIPIRRPSGGELTASSVMCAGLWVAAVGVMQAMQVHWDRIDAGALLLVLWWACASVRFGIRVDAGHRHLVANLLVSAALVGVYQSAWALLS